jgi:RNA polymerase sigma-70 factor (ECF subfamily)
MTISIHLAELERTLERLFKEHHAPLHRYARAILQRSEEADEAVQNVFLRLWEKPDALHGMTSAKAYLYRAVHNESIDRLRRRKTQNIVADEPEMLMNVTTDNSDSAILHSELSHKINAALNTLPQQCRTIFQMSRFEELKYHEIAGQLGLSVKTVENQMGKALRRMREHLSEYL